MRIQKKTILVVDDSPLILERMTALLRRHENAGDILRAAGFSEALQHLQAQKIDIALLDIHLSGKNGIELLRIVHKTYPHIVVIMITNQASEPAAALCKLLGAKYFLDKSNDFARIPEIISSLA